MFRSLLDIDDGFYDPFRQLQEDLDNTFWDWPFSSIRATERHGYPQVNVGTTNEKVLVYIFAPGVEPANIELTIRQGLLSVTGERTVTKEKGRKYYANERYSGKFHRSISLPEYADHDSAEAKYQDGILVVTINRFEPASSTKNIEIK